MRRVAERLVLAAALVALSAPYVAHADIKRDGSVAGDTKKGAGGLLNGNVTVFGVPDPKTGEFSPKLGVKLEGSVYSREWGEGGPCTAKVGLGNGSAEASVGAGLDPFFSQEYGKGAKNPAPAAPTKGPGKLSCTLGVEASLVSVEGECKTPVGTFGASAQGVGGEAKCGCDGCKAEAYWAKAEGKYTTPSVGGCGIKGSVTVKGGVMAGVGAGAEKVGDVGGGITLGPVEVGAGLKIDKLNLGETADCLVNAGKAIAKPFVAVGKGIASLGSSIGNGIKDGIGGLFGGGGGASKVIGSIGGLFGGGGGASKVFSGIGGLFGGGGNNAPRYAPTQSVAVSAGISIPVDGAIGAGMAR